MEVPACVHVYPTRVYTHCYLYTNKCKNHEVGCRPCQKLLKQEGTVRRIESMQQSSATPKNQDVGRGLWKIVACSQSSSQCLLVLARSHPYILLHFYTCSTHFFSHKYSQDTVGSLASTVHDLASFPGCFCGGEENWPGHHCWRMHVVPIKTWEFMHICTLSAYTLVICRNISVHDYECLSV